jgi:hypothetical protein
VARGLRAGHVGAGRQAVSGITRSVGYGFTNGDLTLASTWQVAGGKHLIALARSGVLCGLIYLIYFVSSGLAKVGVASSSLVSRSIPFS